MRATYGRARSRQVYIRMHACMHVCECVCCTKCCMNVFHFTFTQGLYMNIQSSSVLRISHSSVHSPTTSLPTLLVPRAWIVSLHSMTQPLALSFFEGCGALLHLFMQRMFPPGFERRVFKLLSLTSCQNLLEAYYDFQSRQQLPGGVQTLPECSIAVEDSHG